MSDEFEGAAATREAGAEAEDHGVRRKSDGRFAPGTRGGPGARKGSTADLNAYRQEIRDAIRSGGSEALRQVLDGLRTRATKGDAQAAKLWLRYYLPRPVDADPHGLVTDLGDVDFGDPVSVSAAFNSVLRAYNAGEIDEEKAGRLSDMIDRGANLVTIDDMAKKLDRLEAVLADREMESDEV